MSANEQRVWGVHAGKTGDADQLFLKKSCVAIGWAELGDLSKFSKDRESFKNALVKAYPSMKLGAIPMNAGQLFRFVHELQPGDFVVYPSKRDREVHVGTVQGAYLYSTEGESGYPNRRNIKWISALPRTHFSQGALYEIGSAMSFFQVKNYADEFTNAATGQSPAIPEEVDKTIAPVAENIEENTQDWILKKLATELKGHPLADFIAQLLNTMGYQTRVSPEGPDGGIDILAHKDELGFVPPIVKVQVKSSEGSIGDPIVSALYGKVAPGEFGLLVALGTFVSAR